MQQATELVYAKEVIKFDITEAAIAKMKEKYMGLTIAGLDDKEGYEKVNTARKKVVKKRTSVEKRRKELKADALSYGKRVDAEANRIKDLLEPIESYLVAEKTKIDNEVSRIEKERTDKIQAKIDAMRETKIDPYGMTVEELQTVLSLYENKEIAPEEFFELTADAEIVCAQIIETAKAAIEVRKKADQDAAKRKAEEERLAKERAELEKARKDQEEKDRIECEKREAEEAKLRAEREELEAEKKKLEALKREEAAKIERERIVEEERKKAEQEAKEAIERAEKKKAECEAAEKAEVERQERLKPDKQKLQEWVNYISNLDLPDLENEESMKIRDDIVDGIFQILAAADKWIKKL